jgi:hypothetical protein
LLCIGAQVPEIKAIESGLLTSKMGKSQKGDRNFTWIDIPSLYLISDMSPLHTFFIEALRYAEEAIL